MITEDMAPPPPNSGEWVEAESIDGEVSLITSAPGDELMKSKLENIVVSVDGNEYQADERSRNLISQAIDASSLLNEPSTKWRMANNQWRETTLVELRMINAKGLQMHGKIMSGLD